MKPTTTWLGRALVVERGEWAPLLTSAAFFFAVLAAVFVVRAMRETVSTIAGVEDLPELWTYTFAFSIAANVGFWWLANRMPRRRFVPLSLHACAACLLAFWLLLNGPAGDLRVGVAYAFYAWYSAFNMCIVSLFWVCMVDDFDDRRARRLFGPVAVGGTLGGMIGSAIAAQAVHTIGNAGLFAIAAGAVELAVVCHLVRERAVSAWRAAERRQRTITSAGVWQGLVLVARDPTLRWIAVFVLAMTAAQTGFYLVQAEFVPEVLPNREDRTEYYAFKDVATQALTLLVQLLLASRIMRRVGVGGALLAVPLLATLALTATSLWPSIALLFVVHAVWDAGRHGLVRPAREVLFTPLGAEAKYKSKPFLDVVVLRGGDVAWANLFALFPVRAIPWVALPLALAWGIVGWLLGRRHDARENRLLNRPPRP